MLIRGSNRIVDLLSLKCRDLHYEHCSVNSGWSQEISLWVKTFLNQVKSLFMDGLNWHLIEIWHMAWLLMCNWDLPLPPSILLGCWQNGKLCLVPNWVKMKFGTRNLSNTTFLPTIKMIVPECREEKKNYGNECMS